MGIPQQGSIEGPQRQHTNQNEEGQNRDSSPDVNGGIRSANSAAEGFLSEVKEVEDGLLDENRSLTVTVAARELTISGLNEEIKTLREQLRNRSDCDEDDDEIEYKTDEELANPSKSQRASPNHVAISD